TKNAGRSVHAKAVLGEELYARLPRTKVLLVGAGGIGCELLKNIVLTGFGHITLLDLDTIDLSNLNRQFLFKKKDVKQSKALVAAKTASTFNPNVRITPIHGNIKEPQFDIAWFRGFDLVLNALDNLDARRHVNKMCIAANIPLVESGTAGYLGQVQPIIKDRTECFDCIPKPTPKTFPVCTIRSTPSQPIHCIVWAKNYLLPLVSHDVCTEQSSSLPRFPEEPPNVLQLFGEDEDSGGELDDAEKQGENAQEIATLRKEALAFKTVRAALRTPPKDKQVSSAAKMVFHSDILNLLSMADMWRSRAPPTPLAFDAIADGTFSLDAKRAEVQSQNGRGHRKSAKVPVTKGNQGISGASGSGSAGTEKTLNGTSSSASSATGLKDQRSLSLHDNLDLFVASTEKLAVRLRAGEDTISFDKDDDDTLDFVTAAANLRSAAYGIAGKSRWEVKEMAGNIIPAIATTNAIIAGLIVLQALHLLRKLYNALRNVHVQFKPSMPLSTISMSAPNPNCGVCRDTYAELLCDPARTVLGDLVEAILGDGVTDGTGARDVSVYEDKRVLSDPDWDDNNDRTLESLNVTRGKFLAIVDEEGEWGTIQVAVGALPPNHPSDGPAFILPSPLPKPPRKVKPATPTLKRSAPDDEELEPSAKRIKTNGTVPSGPSYSPSKKKRLEEDGLLLLDHADEKMDDDVILID
ncbi:hypothetical protein B0H21DRAFT_863854, partial [Amylocystis lapponica]